MATMARFVRTGATQLVVLATVQHANTGQNSSNARCTPTFFNHCLRIVLHSFYTACNFSFFSLSLLLVPSSSKLNTFEVKYDRKCTINLFILSMIIAVLSGHIYQMYSKGKFNKIYLQTSCTNSYFLTIGEYTWNEIIGLILSLFRFI